MSTFGIYTLANDFVYDQIIALLNSIEVNAGTDIPVCIIPYDDKIQRITQEVSSRKNVTIYDNHSAIQYWEEFAREVWKNHPVAKQPKFERNWWSTGHLQRKMCAFNGPFERFVFIDADCLVMKRFDNIFEKLNNYDFIFDDWIHTKPRHKVCLNIDLLEASGFTEAEIRTRLHCSDFFASKRNIFNQESIKAYQELLIQKREVEWLTSFWDDAHLFNYLTFKSNLSLFNFTLSPNGQERTGNCANADAFANIDNVLYNAEGLKPINRIHYMEYPAVDFARLCAGESVNILYRDVFMYYRFLKEPENKPQEFKSPSSWTKFNRFVQKGVKKIQRSI